MLSCADETSSHGNSTLSFSNQPHFYPYPLQVSRPSNLILLSSSRFWASDYEDNSHTSRVHVPIYKEGSDVPLSPQRTRQEKKRNGPARKKKYRNTFQAPCFWEHRLLRKSRLRSICMEAELTLLVRTHFYHLAFPLRVLSSICTLGSPGKCSEMRASAHWMTYFALELLLTEA